MAIKPAAAAAVWCRKQHELESSFHTPQSRLQSICGASIKVNKLFYISIKRACNRKELTYDLTIELIGSTIGPAISSLKT